MNASRGQALIELALSAPIVILLALGVAAVVQVEDAAAGLDAATHAAASTAARATDAATADAAAHARFDAVAAGYPLRDATLRITYGSFARNTHVTAQSEAFVDVRWAGLVFPHRLQVRSRAVIRVERFRTHRVSI